MSRGPTTFRQRDATALIKAALAAGVEIARVELDKDGKIVLVAGIPKQPIDGLGDDINEWDQA